MKLIDNQIRFDDVSEEYKAFVDKFKPKKTTDDCYTPEAVFDIVADYVTERYGIAREQFVRPFWPGGTISGRNIRPGAASWTIRHFRSLREL